MTCDDVKKELALRLVGLGAREKTGKSRSMLKPAQFAPRD